MPLPLPWPLFFCACFQSWARVGLALCLPLPFCDLPFLSLPPWLADRERLLPLPPRPFRSFLTPPGGTGVGGTDSKDFCAAATEGCKVEARAAASRSQFRGVMGAGLPKSTVPVAPSPVARCLGGVAARLPAGDADLLRPGVSGGFGLNLAMAFFLGPLRRCLFFKGWPSGPRRVVALAGSAAALKPPGD